MTRVNNEQQDAPEDCRLRATDGCPAVSSVRPPGSQPDPDTAAAGDPEKKGADPGEGDGPSVPSSPRRGKTAIRRRARGLARGPEHPEEGLQSDRRRLMTINRDGETLHRR